MSLYDDILGDIKDRTEWANKHSLWHQFRNGGVKRAAKPYPNAPDQHFPLIDSTIDKTKPFYVQQIYANDTIASFVSRNPQTSDVTSQVAAWFDYQLKQRSNFEREAISAIDGLLQNGGTPVKVRWSEGAKRVEFCACDPLHVIVPKHTEELRDADRIVHVIPLSVAQYKRNKSYKQDTEFIRRVKGRGTGNDNGDTGGKMQEVEAREGITCGKDNEIIVWEIFERQDDNSIRIKTRCPVAFEEEVRPEFTLPFDQGVFGEGWMPFVKWRPEITKKGYYSPRGVAEIQAPFETGLNKAWNFMMEWMDFFVRPMFKRASAFTGSLANWSSAPGSVLPEGLDPINPPPIPSALGDSMNMMRQLAEYRMQAPDFGVMTDGGGKRTATEISAISGQSGQGSDLRARVFRLDLGDSLKMAWALLLQYGRESLEFTLHGQSKSLEPASLDDVYDIEPSGSADSWNKGAQMAKAVARFNMHRGSPFVNQAELTKSVLELDDPGLVARLFVAPQDAQATETEEQATEILLMLNGFAATVDPTDDDKAHLISLGQFVERRMSTGEPITPEFARLSLKHGMDHDAAMEQKKDPALRQMRQQFQPMIQMLSQIAAQPDPREMAQQQNVVPMQQQQPMPQEAMV